MPASKFTLLGKAKEYTPSHDDPCPAAAETVNSLPGSSLERFRRLYFSKMTIAIMNRQLKVFQ